MKNSLESILKELDEKCEILSEEEISMKIKDSSNSETDDFKFISEVIAFDLRPHKEGSNWGTYYGHLCTFKDENGSLSEYPRREDIDSEKLDYWLSRLKVTQNPIMKSRYADLVWEFSETVGKKKDFKMAQAVIDNNITIVKERLYNNEFSALSKLERGLYLALKLSDKVRIKTIKELILEFEDAIAEDEKPGTWSFSFDLLLKNRIDLTAAERSKIISDLEERVKRLRSNANPEPWSVETAAIRLAGYYKKSGNSTKVSKILNELKEECKKYGETVTPMQYQSWLDKLHAYFMQFQPKEEVSEIRREIYENGLKIRENLIPISQSMTFQDEELDKITNTFLSDNIYIDLLKLSYEFVPKEERVIEQIKALAKNAPLLSLMTKTVVDDHGRKVAEIGNTEDDLEGNIIQQISSNINIQAIFLDKTIKKIIEHHDLNCEKLLSILMESPVFLEERRELLEKSLQLYFNEDYISFCHIVIPQIESAFRTLLSLCERPILKTSENRKGHEFKVLGDLLRDPIIEDVYDLNYKKYFQVLLNNQAGLNLRNHICHGISNVATFNQYTANLLLHVLISLSLFLEDVTTA